MTSRPNVPVIFPPASFIIRSAASHPPGPLGRVPRPHRYYQPTPTSRPPSRVTSFPSLSATTAPPSSLPRSRTIPRGPGPLLSRRPRRLSSVEKTRYPRFLGDPCVHAPLFDPGGPPTPGHYRTGDVVFRTLNNVDSAFAPFEARSRGLHALCVRFAAGVAPGPRNTRFRLVASLDRSGLSPAGSHRWFTVMSFRLHGVLHHQASPGAVESRAGAPTVGSGGDSVAFAPGLNPAPMVTFPAPALRTRRADFRHRALQWDHAPRTRTACASRTRKRSGSPDMICGCGTASALHARPVSGAPPSLFTPRRHRTTAVRLLRLCM